MGQSKQQDKRNNKLTRGTTTDMQEKVKARLCESRLLALSGRGGSSSRNLAFAFSCMSAQLRLLVRFMYARSTMV